MMLPGVTALIGAIIGKMSIIMVIMTTIVTVVMMPTTMMIIATGDPRDGFGQSLFDSIPPIRARDQRGENPC